MTTETPVKHELAKAEAIAQGIVDRLKPYSDRIEIAGSIRRKRSLVHDIDLVLIPFYQNQLVQELMAMGGSLKLAGEKLIRLQLPEIQVDLYIATRETWATLLLIRTGSTAHNRKLCTMAIYRGMKLHADGSGLTRDGERIAGDTEESIFHALGLEYVPPERREY